MDIFVHPAWKKGLTDYWTSFDLVEYDYKRMKEVGGCYFNVEPEALAGAVYIDGMKITYVQTVFSWGIIQHVDQTSSDLSLLIPIRTDGYKFAYFLDGKQIVVEDVDEHILFEGKSLHSLAPTRKIETPFICMVVDFNYEN